MAVADALALDRPVVMGCSIRGRVVLHLALNRGRRFRAAIGLLSGAKRRRLRHADDGDGRARPA
ncbi:hypothetical protein [Sphingomonas sp.]|uniref:hypothetical protein n=1 Tax=Sphingomonas sp. TaxID=28214 RepID=UPI003CC5CBC0